MTAATIALVLAAMVGAEEVPVNVPYPLSGEQAAKEFLRLVDALKPAPWAEGHPQGDGPFILVGTLQAKTYTRDGDLILMVALPSKDSVLIRCGSPLPEVAVEQRVYMVVDFLGPDGAAAGRLRAIVLASDMKDRSRSLDAMLGLCESSKPAQGSTPSPSSASTFMSQGGQGGAQSAAVSGFSWQQTPPVAAAAVAPPLGAVSALPQPQAARQPLLETPEEQYRVQYWKAYAKERNARLTDAEAEAIVRWVLYYSAYYGVDHRLIFAVMRYESDFDPGCVSHAGAIGLMQLMPETARDLGVDPWVVEENIRGGIAELAGYLDRYADRPNYEQTVLALACYNAGPNAVKRAGGVPPITETINYVQRVTDLFYRFVKSGAP